jgi:hypothetical protein
LAETKNISQSSGNYNPQPEIGDGCL